MKILIMVKKWEGGVGVATKSIIKELKRKGHVIKTISREDDLKIYSFSSSIIKLRNAVKREMRENDYDIIYTRDWSMAFPLIFPYPIFKKKHYCGFGGLEKKLFSRLLWNITGIVLGKRLICYGDTVKSKMKKANKITNGIDSDLFMPNKGLKRVEGSVGFVNWKTDFYNYSKIKSAAKELGLKLMVAENIPHSEMPKFYNKIEMFVSIPHGETGFNLCWIEAMACGVPKVVGSNSGIGNILPITKLEKYKNIKEALKNAKKRNYRKWIIDNGFSWEKTTDKLIKLWENDNR